MKGIYSLLCAMFVFLIISMIFFLVAHVEGNMMGTPEQEAEDYITRRMQKFIKETKGNQNSSANKGSGADAKLIADRMDDIMVATEIVPNNDQNNWLFRRMK